MHADDLDTGYNGKIIYVLDIDLPVFHINASTGVITVQGPLDRESKDQYKVRTFENGASHQYILVGHAHIHSLLSR